jgi:hypothetical protein
VVLEAYAGGRVTDLRLELNARHRLDDRDKRETCVDPVIGVQGETLLTKHWERFGGGDIGGFGVGSDLTRQWFAGAGYRFDLLARETFLRAGWRMLAIDYDDGFKWDVTYSGPMLGLTRRL